MVEIEKSVIRPTYAEWADIYSLGKEITFHRKLVIPGGRTDIAEDFNPLPLYQRAVEENKEITRDDMPDLDKKFDYDLFRLKGFNSMSQAKKYIAVMKNPDITNIEVFIEGEEEIVRLEFELEMEQKPVDKSKYIFTPSPDSVTYVSGKLVTGGYETISSLDAEPTRRVKLFDFENSEEVGAYFATIKDVAYNPIDNSFTDKSGDEFLPTVKILEQNEKTNDYEYDTVKALLKENHIYFLTTVEDGSKLPKALNRLSNGKQYKQVSLVSLKNNELAREELNEILPQLEPLPNEYKKYEEKLNEFFEPNSTKKLIRRMQYMTRLEARKTREGRGLGKYTGDREFSENRPKLYYGVTITQNYVYNPRNKSGERVILLSFFVERNGRVGPADNHMLFVNEAFVPSYFGESDRNKEWVRVSYNIAQDAVDGIIAYVKDLQTRYRSRKKLDFSSMSDKMINAFDINLNEIMENSFFSYLTYDKRRGRRLNVKKSNMLKSATDIKNTFNEILRSKFGPFKEIKNLNKEELQTLIDEMSGFYKRNYNFEDTRFNIEFEYVPYSEENIDSVMRNAEGFNNQNAVDLINRKNSLDGDLKQYFSIRNRTKTREESMMGMLVICYYFNGDELDRIEAVSLTLQRVEYRPNVVQQVNKDISIEYPADEIGVFMYEIMTGMRRDTPLLLGRRGGSVSASPSKVASQFFYDSITGEFGKFILVNNMKYNEIRNDYVGFLVGKNAINKMYGFLYSDSTLQGAYGKDAICAGKMDLFYKLKGGSSFTGGNLGFVNRLEDFEDFKRRVTIGLNATTTGSCLHMQKHAPKNDQIFAYVSIFLGGSGSDKDFLDGKITTQILQGGPVGGTNTQRLQDRVELNQALYTKFGPQFGEFMDSLVKKAVESGEIKLGAKYVRIGTSMGDSFDPSKDNHAIIYTPPETEESVEQGENLSDEEEAMRLFRLNMGRDPDFRRQEDLDMFEMLRDELDRWIKWLIW